MVMMVVDAALLALIAVEDFTSWLPRSEAFKRFQGSSIDKHIRSQGHIEAFGVSVAYSNWTKVFLAGDLDALVTNPSQSHPRFSITPLKPCYARQQLKAEEEVPAVATVSDPGATPSRVCLAGDQGPPPQLFVALCGFELESTELAGCGPLFTSGLRLRSPKALTSSPECLECR